MNIGTVRAILEELGVEVVNGAVRIIDLEQVLGYTITGPSHNRIEIPDEMAEDKDILEAFEFAWLLTIRYDALAHDPNLLVNIVHHKKGMPLKDAFNIVMSIEMENDLKKPELMTETEVRRVLYEDFGLMFQTLE